MGDGGTVTVDGKAKGSKTEQANKSTRDKYNHLEVITFSMFVAFVGVGPLPRCLAVMHIVQCAHTTFESFYSRKLYIFLQNFFFIILLDEQSSFLVCCAVTLYITLNPTQLQTNTQVADNS